MASSPSLPVARTPMSSVGSGHKEIVLSSRPDRRERREAPAMGGDLQKIHGKCVACKNLRSFYTE